MEAQSLIRGDLRRNVSRQPRRKTDGRRAQPPSLRSYGEPRESAAVVVGEAQPPGLHSSHAPCSATRSTAHFQLSFFGNASNSSCFRSTCLRASIIQRSVIPLCECPLQPFHTRHQVGLRRLQQEVIVIPHQHIGMNPEPRPPAHFGQRIQKAGRIAPVAKDRLSPHPMTHHMINGPRVVNAYAPWHSHTMDGPTRLDNHDLQLCADRPLIDTICNYVRTDPLLTLCADRPLIDRPLID